MNRWTAALAAALCGAMLCARADDVVVVYAAHDEMYSGPILDAFEEQTGIEVKAAYDVEASKTTGLVNRLIAEKDHPRADVFWNNEAAQTIVLQRKGVLIPYVSPAAKTIPPAFKDPEGHWTGFAARARVLIYNTDLVSEPPTSVFNLTDERWRGQAGIALPLFGTTAMHAAALFATLGEERAKAYFQALKANDVQIVSGNATCRDMVAQGELKVGLTDTDDANGAVLDGRPARWLFPDQGEGQLGTLVIPNSVCLIRGAPHPDQGRKLIDFLLSPEIEARLARGRSMQMPLHPGVDVPKNVPKLEDIRPMDVDFYEVSAQMTKTAKFIQETFAR